MSIKDDFVAAFRQAVKELKADPNADIEALGTEAVGIALEKVLVDHHERHTHYHIPPGSVLRAVGDVVTIEPYVQEVSGGGIRTFDPDKLAEAMSRG